MYRKLDEKLNRTIHAIDAILSIPTDSVGSFDVYLYKQHVRDRDTLIEKLNQMEEDANAVHDVIDYLEELRFKARGIHSVPGTNIMSKMGVDSVDRINNLITQLWASTAGQIAEEIEVLDTEVEETYAWI